MLHFSSITLCSPNFPRYPDGGEDIYFEMHFHWPTYSERGSYLPHAKVARVHPEGSTLRHDARRSPVGWAASSTEAASDPLALAGLIIAAPLGMLEQVSNRARPHHITPTPHCWQLP